MSVMMILICRLSQPVPTRRSSTFRTYRNCRYKIFSASCWTPTDGLYLFFPPMFLRDAISWMRTLFDIHVFSVVIGISWSAATSLTADGFPSFRSSSTSFTIRLRFLKVEDLRRFVCTLADVVGGAAVVVRVLASMVARHAGRVP